MSADYSVILPVFRIEGNKYLDRLLASLATQELKPIEVHIVSGDPRQGRAINHGAAAASTKYIATLDDDSIIDSPDLFARLVAAMEADPTIGIGGASCLIPPNAAPLQKKAMREIPRRFFPVQQTNVDSDMVQHPCLIAEKEFFFKIGGEDEMLVRGLDPSLRKRARDAGKRVTIIADTWVYHALPETIRGIMKMYYRNGRGSGFALRFYPEKIIELTDGYDKGAFTERRPLPFRIARRLWNLFSSVLTGKYIRLLAEVSYTLGVLKEYSRPAYSMEKPLIASIRASEKTGLPYKCVMHETILAER